MFESNLDLIYEKLITQVLKQNKKIEDELGEKLHNFNTLHNDVSIPFSNDGRMLHVRVLKIPTFIINNKPSYYALILSDISLWRKGEIKQLHGQIVECFDNHDVDSYTIFQQGEFHGYFDPVLNKNTRQYNMFILHGTILTRKQQNFIIDITVNYLESRCRGITDGIIVYNRLKKDVARLRCFCEDLQLLFKPVMKQVYTVVKE